MRPFVQHYDAIYSDKNYRADTEILRSLVTGAARPSILEIGSGTGNQSLLLNEWADVTAVETDADFAQILRVKTSLHSSIHVYDVDVGGLPHTAHDGAAAYFHVVNYIHHASDLLHLFRQIAKRLKPGAPFLFDMWHGECVLNDPPREATRVKPFDHHAGQGKVTQIIKPQLDSRTHNVTLNYTITVEPEGATFNETIRLHLWQQGEIVDALRQAGFSDISFHDGRDVAKAATPASWALWVVARI